MAIDPITLYEAIPSRPNTKPPRSDPTTPTTRSPTRPNPVPRMIFPASQPAMIPMRMSRISPTLLLHHDAPGLALDVLGDIERSVRCEGKPAGACGSVARVHDLRLADESVGEDFARPRLA